MNVTAGTRLGRYEIRSKIGAGGMGEVFLAQDTKLYRKVALKILPAEVAADRSRMNRFVQEAKAASGLNHPNILTIYEIDQADSVHFIATEFIDGETLRQRMKSAPLKLGDVLDVTAQIASALSAAHTAGIVHRDIKPENIMLRDDGIVKVLDFGLAKLTERLPPESVDTEAPTSFKTDPGTVVGTAFYMSPEQARGMPVDARTDIFSLGVVLYEVVAGRLPFEGSTSGEVLAAILSEKKPQPLARYSREVPAELERIVSKALRKNRDERYQTIKDLLVDLKELKRELELQAQLERRVASELGSRATTEISEPAMAETAPTQVAQTGAGSTAPTTSSAEYIVSQIKSHKRVIAIALAALIVIAGGLAFWLYRLIGQKAPSSSQAMKITRLTSTGKSRLAVISADGKYVVHVIEDAGKQSLWMRQTAIESNVQILAPADGSFGGLTFSRDGNYIYYIWGQRGSFIQTLYQLPVLGGEPRKLITDIASAVTFSPDGKQVSFVRNPPSAAQSALMSANADGSGEKTLATRKQPDQYVGTPAWSPDGKTIAVPVQGEQHVDVVVVPAAGGQEKPLGTERWIKVGQLAWLADGSALLMDAGDQNSYFGSQLYEVSYPGGQVRRVTNDLNNYGGVSLTEDSNALVTVQGDSPTSLWVAPEGKAERARQLSPGTGNYEGFVGVDWTPDGKVIFTSYAGGRAQLWIIGADASGRKQLTVDGQFNLFPGVSPDGKYIVFVSNRLGGDSIWRMDADGGNERQLTRGDSVDSDIQPKISPDGKWVVFTGKREGKNVILKVSIEGSEPVQVTPHPGHAPVISPDGKWIVFHMWDEGANKFRQAVMPFEGGEPVKIFDHPGDATWARDSKGLIYRDSQGGVDNLWLQPLDGGKPKQLTNFTSDQIWHWAWSRDGKQLALSRYSTTSDVVLISGFR